MLINIRRLVDTDYNGEAGSVWNWDLVLSEEQLDSLPQSERELYLGPALKARLFPNIEVRGCQFRLRSLDGNYQTQNSGIAIRRNQILEYGYLTHVLAVTMGTATKVYMVAEMFSTAPDSESREIRASHSQTSSQVLFPEQISGQVFYSPYIDDQTGDPIMHVFSLHTSRFVAAAAEVDEQGALQIWGYDVRCQYVLVHLLSGHHYAQWNRPGLWRKCGKIGKIVLSTLTICAVIELCIYDACQSRHLKWDTLLVGTCWLRTTECMRCTRVTQVCWKLLQLFEDCWALSPFASVENGRYFTIFIAICCQ